MKDILPLLDHASRDFCPDTVREHLQVQSVRDGHAVVARPDEPYGRGSVGDDDGVRSFDVQILADDTVEEIRDVRT